MKRIILLILCLIMFIAQANAFLLTGAKSIGEGKSDLRLALTREFLLNMTNFYFDRFNLIYDLNLLEGLDMQAMLGYNNFSMPNSSQTINGLGFGLALKKELWSSLLLTSLYLRYEGGSLVSNIVSGSYYRADTDFGLIFSKPMEGLEPYGAVMLKSYTNNSNGSFIVDGTPAATMEYVLGLNFRPQEGIKFAIELANEVQQTKNTTVWNNNQLSASLSFSR